MNRDISANLDRLTDATTVSITFEFQKKNVRDETISHQKSFDNIDGGEMCPIRAAAEIIKQLYSYNIPREEIMNIPINYMEIDGKGYRIPSSTILLKI